MEIIADVSLLASGSLACQTDPEAIRHGGTRIRSRRIHSEVPNESMISITSVGLALLLVLTSSSVYKCPGVQVASHWCS